MFNMAKLLCENDPNKIAIIWSDNKGNEKKYTYNLLNRLSSQFANLLIANEVKKGDKVLVYMKNIPELFPIVLGILKAGAIFCPVFSSSGIESLEYKITDCMPSVIISQSLYQSNIRRILSTKQLNIKSVVVSTDIEDIVLEKNEVLYSDVINNYSDIFNAYNTSKNDISTIHYTSGTTSMPKGVMHRHGNIDRYLYTFKTVFNISSNDIYWCTADHAWITGSIYGIFAPLAAGVTIVVTESGFRGSYICNILEKYKINVWYTAPTLLRMLMRENNDIFDEFNFTELRGVFCVGEALNSEVIKWGEEKLNKTIRDTWFQTETGSIIIANYDGLEVKSGSMGKPLLDVEIAILDNNFNELPPNNIGKLAIKPGWSSMYVNYLNKDKVYNSKFINDWYITGDMASIDLDGYVWFKSREDDVINTAGHLVSPFEIESIIMKCNEVAEVAVVGKEDSLIGEKVKAYIVLKDQITADRQLEMQIRKLVRHNHSPYAVPQEIEFTNRLPVTYSGKIIRRLL